MIKPQSVDPNARSYKRPQVQDRGAVEAMTKDFPGSINPEYISDILIWDSFVEEKKPVK